MLPLDIIGNRIITNRKLMFFFFLMKNII